MTTSNRLRVPAAAAYLGLAVSTLNKMRCTGAGPCFVKAGARAIIYNRRDLDAWMESRTCSSTSEYQSGKAKKTS